MTILAVIGVVLIGTTLIISIIVLSLSKDVIYRSIVVTHYPVTFGLPMAAIAALVLVFLLEYARGPIAFKVPGLEFEGAAGPLVLWVFVYLAMASSIALLWDDTMSSDLVDNMFEEELETAILKERYERCQMEKEFQDYNEGETRKLCAQELREAIKTRDNSGTGASEYERLRADLVNELGDLNVLAEAQEDAERQDLTMLSKTIGWDARLVKLFEEAVRLSADADVQLPQNALYGLMRAGLPSDKRSLARVEPDVVEQVLKMMRETGIVEISDREIGRFKQQFSMLAERSD